LSTRSKCVYVFLTAALIATSAFGQAPAPAAAAAPAAPAAPAGPMPPSAPSFSGPLANIPPAIFDAGPFGKIDVNGVVSGLGTAQNNPVPGDSNRHADMSNGQVFVQKTDGWFQFYVQAGVYNLPDLGTPYLGTNDALSNLYGPVPVAFLKLQAGKNTSFEIGSLPTLIGAEYTFSFENMNVQRGLLWNQETAVSRGIQVNQTMGKFSASVSWNDGFYSDRYTWISGSLAYANGPNTLTFVAGGNMGQTKFQTLATPVQNNGSIFNVIYMYSKGSWMIMPYYQYTSVPTDTKIGVVNGASTSGGAILVSYAMKHGFSLPFRFEYIGSSGSAANNSVNLLYGPGSSGTSFTVTPTLQKAGFFVRGDLGFVHAGSAAKGAVFGPAGLNDSQFRAAAEIGFVFGSNVEKKP
jgi:putative OmpL-like beta-barrel porin-2